MGVGGVGREVGRAVGGVGWQEKGGTDAASRQPKVSPSLFSGAAADAGFQGRTDSWQQHGIKMPGCRLRKEAKGRGEGDGVRRRSLRHWGAGRPQPVPPLQHLTLTLERGKKSVGGVERRTEPRSQSVLQSLNPGSVGYGQAESQSVSISSNN